MRKISMHLAFMYSLPCMKNHIIRQIATTGLTDRGNYTTVGCARGFTVMTVQKVKGAAFYFASGQSTMKPSSSQRSCQSFAPGQRKT